MPPPGVWDLLKSNGLATFLLIALMWAGWKFFLPWFKDLINESKLILTKEAEAARSALARQTDSSEVRLIAQGQEFTKALTAMSERQIEMLSKEFTKLNVKVDQLLEGGGNPKGPK